MEGNIHDKLGDEAEALAAYDKCAEINPEYEYGYIGKGILLYNKALNLQEAASKKWMMPNTWLLRDFEIALKDCMSLLKRLTKSARMIA